MGIIKMTEIAVQRVISDLIDEYDEKYAAVDENVRVFEKAGDKLKLQSTVAGVYGQENIDVGRVYTETVKRNLLTSAWQACYQRMKIGQLASAKDKNLFEQSISQGLPPFTKENIRETFGKYYIDPKGNILRGLAEVFCSLDQAYKSHDKVKIGVKGLPKRIIISSISDYCYGWGHDKIRDVLNALANYQGLPLVTHKEMQELIKNGELLENKADEKTGKIELYARGVHLKRFKNGNGHLFFDDVALNDINKALAEYYGDALQDETGEKPTKKAESTELSKDLQYYPTPKAAAETLIEQARLWKAESVLEPSCGCGRLLDEIRLKDGNIKTFGVEVDYNRAQEAKNKGHSVQVANFLKLSPQETFDRVIMNPPFAGKHYVKHIDHAYKFLKTGGRLVSILPITAKTDHNILDKKYNCAWYDLPFGSFRESGTNINTTIVVIDKK